MMIARDILDARRFAEGSGRYNDAKKIRLWVLNLLNERDELLRLLGREKEREHCLDRSD
jgi:hypothetical protein